jgi:hypothetical protein
MQQALKESKPYKIKVPWDAQDIDFAVYPASRISSQSKKPATGYPAGFSTQNSNV